MNLLKALATVSGMTLLSRILGFIRDFVIARTFGAGLATDAFFVAFKLPNLLRRMFAEGAFSQAFVPILGEYKHKQAENEVKTLIDQVCTALFWVLLLITLLGMAGAAALVWLSAPGFAKEPEKFELTVTLTRITFPYIFFMSLVALSGGILNTWSRFSIPAFTPVLLNVSFIGMAWFATPYFDPPALALGWAVFIGGGLQLALQIPALLKIRMLPRPHFNWRAAWAHPGVRRIALLMAPALIGVSVSQISLLINTMFASFLGTGAVSWLYYADRLMEFPSGMLGAALGTILLPSLSKLHASNNQEEYARLLDWGLRLTLLLAAPASLALGLLGVPLIATLFFHGAFNEQDVLNTQSALAGYAVGLTALILVKILAPGFYARQNVKTPLKIALTSLFATQLMNIIFMQWLHHAGLALSISLAAILNAALLYRGLRQQNIYTPAPGWHSFLLKLALGMVSMGLILFFGAGSAQSWLSATFHARIVHLAWLIPLGAGGYFATLWLLGFRLNDFKRKAI